MKGQIIKSLKIIIPAGIGVYLTWYFISGLTQKDIDQTYNAIFEANYFWVILSLLLAVLSHMSRAYRWLFLLDPLGYKPSFSSSFYAVMSGYIINFTVPRSGEVARAGLLASAEDVPFEKGFATIVVERVIDVLMLGLIFLISGYLQINTDQFKEITETDDQSGNFWFWIIGGSALFLGIGALIMYFKVEKVRNFLNEKIRGFWDGLKSIWTMKKKWAFLFHTIFIWVCYVGMIWVSAQAFQETKDMSIECIFGAFIVGAAAIALLPGGLGAYPAWVTQVLFMVDGIDFAAYGIFVWVIQTLLIVILGLISLFIIQRRIKV